MSVHTRRYSARDLLIVLAVWTGLATLSILQTALYLEQSGRAIEWIPLGVTRLLDWYTCLAFAPAYLWLIRRYAFQNGRRLRAAALALLATVAFVPIKYGVLFLLFRTIRPGAGRNTFGSVLVTNFFTEMLFLGGIALAIYAIELYRRVRQAEIESARLDRELAEARLDSLASQLQPHFFFNTLNSVLALIGRDPSGAEEMLIDLSELLKQALRNDGHEISLASELDHLSLYLGIMTRRFGDSLVIDIEVPDAVRNALVPKLILQPIVENALEHGMASRGGVGRISVSAYSDATRLHLVVSDNGTGQRDDNRVEGGIGLANTRRRIEQLYPGDNALSIAAGPSGTFVTITIPFRQPSSAT